MHIAVSAALLNSSIVSLLDFAVIYIQYRLLVAELYSALDAVLYCLLYITH